MSKCAYNKCDGSGLIPFRKDGQVIPYCWLHCDCHPIYGLNPEPEHYQPARVEDWDFPCSDTFRGASFDYCGQPDPGRDNMPSEPVPVREPVEVTVRHVSVFDFAGRRQVRRLGQLEQHVTALEKKQHTHKKRTDKYL